METRVCPQVHCAGFQLICRFVLFCLVYSLLCASQKSLVNLKGFIQHCIGCQTSCLPATKLQHLAVIQYMPFIWEIQTPWMIGENIFGDADAFNSLLLHVLLHGLQHVLLSPWPVWLRILVLFAQLHSCFIVYLKQILNCVSTLFDHENLGRLYLAWWIIFAIPSKDWWLCQYSIFLNEMYYFLYEVLMYVHIHLILNIEEICIFA